MRKQTRLVYPFSAIVGQEDMKKALLLNAINPNLGGVLIRGEKGTAKSIAVRGLGQLLPEIEVVRGCPFHCDPAYPEGMCERCAGVVDKGERLEVSPIRVPVVDMPVGATEDRVVGTLDIESAIKTGEKNFEPGLIAAANRGVLYIDEVNLLDDHLVDVLLDAAAMGINFVEREGISFTHPARFMLVGTMNPEEGELRPQLLDRFGLAVEIKGIDDLKARAEVVRRYAAFESDPVSFTDSWENEQETLRNRVVNAQESLPGVEIADEMLDLITRICVDFAVDGHRADIVMHKTAITNAAFCGRTLVEEDDVGVAARLSLLHRRRRQPFEDAGFNHKILERSLESWHGEKEQRGEGNQFGREEDDSDDGNPYDAPRGSPDEGVVFEAESPYSVKGITTPLLDRLHRNEKGRRSMSRTATGSGRYVGCEIPRADITDIAFDATLRVAAPRQPDRRRFSPDGPAFLVERHDLRQKVRERRVGNLVLFVLDGSGSMIAEERMVATKGAILSLLLDAYQRRDHVGLIIFRDYSAELVLPPTNSIDLAQKLLRQLPAGGRTPLTHGLRLGLETITDYLRRRKKSIPLLILISDGKGNVGFNGGDPVEEALEACRQIRARGIHAIGIDTEEDTRLHSMERLCLEMGGLYLRPEELKADHLAEAVRERISCWR